MHQMKYAALAPQRRVEGAPEVRERSAAWVLSRASRMCKVRSCPEAVGPIRAGRYCPNTGCLGQSATIVGDHPAWA